MIFDKKYGGRRYIYIYIYIDIYIYYANYFYKLVSSSGNGVLFLFEILRASVSSSKDKGPSQGSLSDCDSLDVTCKKRKFCISLSIGSSECNNA